MQVIDNALHLVSQDAHSLGITCSTSCVLGNRFEQDSLDLSYTFVDVNSKCFLHLLHALFVLQRDGTESRCDFFEVSLHLFTEFFKVVFVNLVVKVLMDHWFNYNFRLFVL